MKPTKTVAALLSAAILMLSVQSAHAQSADATPTPGMDNPKLGWLEGTVLNQQGQTVATPFMGDGVHVRGVRQGGGQFDVQTDLKMGGLYSVHNIKPGVYTVSVPQGVAGNTSTCPTRIFGVLVKAGVRTVLNITTEEGQNLQEVGKPAVATDSVTALSERLAEMQKQIDDLKQQVAALQARLAAVAPNKP